MSRVTRLARRILGQDRIGLLDVGASGGAHRRWRPLRDHLTVYGFEPDPEAFAVLSRLEGQVFFNAGLAGARGPRTLYVTRSQTNTSLLRPDEAVVGRFHWSESGEDHQIKREVSIECETLDHLARERDLAAQILKIDTQGTELEILQAGKGLLEEHVALVEVEVEFVPLYRDQPLFADVDRFLRERGFELLDLGNLLYLKPRGLARTGGPKGQLISADALYVKSSGRLAALPALSTKAAILGLVSYGYPELASSLCLDVLGKGTQAGGPGSIAREILRLRHPSKFIEGVPGTRLLAGLAEKVARHLGRVENARWLNPLGNRLL